MRKRRILLGKLIHQDLIALRSLFLQVNLQNQATLLILFLEPAIAAYTSERLGVLFQIQVVSAGRAEIGFLHLFLFCIGGFLNQILRVLRLLAFVFFRYRVRRLLPPCALAAAFAGATDADADTFACGCLHFTCNRLSFR